VPESLFGAALLTPPIAFAVGVFVGWRWKRGQWKREVAGLEKDVVFFREYIEALQDEIDALSARPASVSEFHRVLDTVRENGGTSD